MQPLHPRPIRLDQVHIPSVREYDGSIRCPPRYYYGMVRIWSDGSIGLNRVCSIIPRTVTILSGQDKPGDQRQQHSQYRHQPHRSRARARPHTADERCCEFHVGFTTICIRSVDTEPLSSSATTSIVTTVLWFTSGRVMETEAEFALGENAILPDGSDHSYV